MRLCNRFGSNMATSLQILTAEEHVAEGQALNMNKSQTYRALILYFSILLRCIVQ
jgi:hypothetical protein